MMVLNREQLCLGLCKLPNVKEIKFDYRLSPLAPQKIKAKPMSLLGYGFFGPIPNG
jgi:hypothetical protein